METAPATSGEVARLRALYLDNMERVLCNSIYPDPSLQFLSADGSDDAESLRREGRDWPTVAHTMIGARRIDQLRRCVEQVLDDDVAGDLIETGVWRGGATIMMNAVLEAYGISDRLVWVADSFRGLPRPNPARYPHDKGLDFADFTELSVPLEDVQANFRKYDLLNERVKFVEGWFSETLSGIAASEFVVIRLDGDLYESTMDALTALYPRLSPGGFAIIDDYGAIAACKAATHDYREMHGITEPVQEIDWTGVYWRKR
jgi:O-methyltransferase